MNGLKDNPLGLTLAATGGVCVLLALAMAIVWSLPEVAESTGIRTEDRSSSGTVLAAHQIAAISEFQVINEKPLFNERHQAWEKRNRSIAEMARRFKIKEVIDSKPEIYL